MSQQSLEPSSSGSQTADSGLPARAAEENTKAKSKAELRAERRTLQEAQRAAKAANKQTTVQKQKETPAAKDEAKKMQKQKETPAAKDEAKKMQKQKETPAVKDEAKKMQTSGSSITKSDVLVTGVKEMKIRVPDSVQLDDERVAQRQTRKLDKQHVPFRQSRGQKKVSLFRHLVQYERDVCLTHGLEFNSSVIHPAVIKLGVQYMEGVITGSNARCISLLTAMKQVISDYRMPPNTEISRDLEMHIRPDISEIFTRGPEWDKEQLIRLWR